jgi:hypothetical protein
VGSIKSLSEDSDAPAYRKRFHIVVKVSETIKGSPAKELTLDLVTIAPAQMLQDFHKSQDRLIWVTPPANEGLRYNLANKMGAVDADHQPSLLWFRLYEPDRAEHFADYDSKVFTLDLRVLSTLDDVLKEMRAFVKKHPENLDLIYYTPPRSVALMCNDPNAYAAVMVPKTPELRKFAQRLIEEPEKVIADARRRSERVLMEPKLSREDVEQLRKEGRRILDDLGNRQQKRSRHHT